MTKAGESILRGAEEALDIARQEKWDLRFIELARLVGSWSKDPSTQTGAVIVRPDLTICSVGYNGFPRSMDDTQILLSDREEKYSRIIHCEMNALLNAKESVKGYTLYTSTFLTCDRCAVHMIQAGIKRVVCESLYPTDSRYARWAPVLEKSRGYYEECGVEVKEFEPGCKT